MAMPSTSRRLSRLNPTVMVIATETMPALAHFQVGGVDPQIDPFTLDRPGEEDIDPLVDVLAKPRHLAEIDTGANGWTRSFMERVDTPCRQAS